MDKKFNIIISAEVRSFIKGLPAKAANKVLRNLNIVAGGLIDPELFKKLVGTDIWEFRTQYMGICYRLLAFWDNDADSIIVTTHGFVKKTDKTPQKEIDKAEQCRKNYFKLKQE